MNAAPTLTVGQKVEVRDLTGTENGTGICTVTKLIKASILSTKYAAKHGSKSIVICWNSMLETWTEYSAH